MVRLSCLILIAALSWATAPNAFGQNDFAFDPAWLQAGQPYVKVAIATDGAYRITGNALAQAGVILSTVDPRTLQVFEEGHEIPIHVLSTTEDQFQATDALLFVGRRHRGDDEDWAYHFRQEWRNPSQRSLFSDTTYYWVTWGQRSGLRYNVTDPLALAPDAPPVNTVWHTAHLEEDLLYYYGDSNFAGHPLYTRGESYYWSRFSPSGTNSQNRNYTLAVPGLRREASDSIQVRTLLSSESALRHRLTLSVRLKTESGNQYVELDEVDWTGYSFQYLQATVAAADLPGNNLEVRVTSHNEFGANPNLVLLDHFTVSYLRQLSADQGRLSFVAAASGPQRFHVSGWTSAPVYVFSPATQHLFIATPAGNAVVFSDTPTVASPYILAQEAGLLTPSSIYSVTTAPPVAPAPGADYVILTRRALHTSAESLAEHHRQALNLDVLIVYAEDVFDRFDYGRDRPIAIKRFVHHLMSWASPPEYLMIWGDAPYPVHTERNQTREAWEIPSFGYAPSDSWFAMHVKGREDWSEALAVGRVPVRTDNDGMLFLQKLQTYEQTARSMWQKKMIMLAGGDSPSQQRQLQNYTTDWGGIATTAPAGMDTLNFFKQKDQPFDPSFQDSLRKALHEGASWISYFGHSAASAWEIVTDSPKDFNNAARLPIVLSFGCFTGGFAGGRFERKEVPSFGEQLVTASLNGAIAHFGASDHGNIFYSGRLGETIHRVVFQDTVRVLGKATQEAKRRVAALTSSSDLFGIKSLLQYNLLGDPAMQMRLPDRPDFHLSENSIRTSSAAPTPTDSLLIVTARVENRGLVPADSVTLVLTHTPPDGNQRQYQHKIPPFALYHSVSFPISLSEASVGINRLTFHVDPSQQYDEMVEEDNVTTIEQVVFPIDVYAVHPAPLGLITTTTPTLRVGIQKQDAAGLPLVLFEMDTTATFTSPAYRTFETEATGTFVDWPLATPLEDTRTYYWRARIIDPLLPPNWATASFTVQTDAGASGWTQVGAQFALNQHDPRLSFDETSQRWQLATYTVEVLATSERGSGSYKGMFSVNGERYESLGLGFGLLILDGNTGKTKAHGSMPLYNNSYEDPVAARAELDAILEKIEEGDHVFVRTRHLGRQGGPDIPDDVKAIFRTLGSTAIDTLDYRDLWIMYTRHGIPNTTEEWVEKNGTQINEIIQRFYIPFSYLSSTTTSPVIGPASSWREVAWKAEYINGTAEVQIDVLDGRTNEVLAENVPTGYDLSALSARDFPYLRLRASLGDPAQRVTPQLRAWHVLYDPVPELAFAPASFSTNADTLQEGQPLNVSAQVANISFVDAARILVRYVVTDAANRTTLVGVDTLHEVSANSQATTRLTIPTENLIGLNRITLTASQETYPEAVTFNNVLVASFNVRGDQTAPSLRLLLDGDAIPHDPNPVINLQDPALPFVSTRPTIEITISDDNAYRLLTDTSAVKITFDGRPVPLNNPAITFHPATDATRNEARVIYTPALTPKDTTHTLRVRVFDASGNEAANSPYQVHFRVQSEVEVEHLYPYPNPMSTATTFAFLLRGSDPSLIEELRIRVYTVNGRPVREFNLIESPDLLESGGLRIGWNKWVWDGRDEDGDLVATGVYLYRVFLRAEGRSLPVGNAIEKLVVIR